MNEDTHVYCTNCKWFRIDDEDIPYCPFEDTCDIGNCEDSMSFADRPRYEERENQNDDYVYIIITNNNPEDFQSMVIKYKSWDKFITDIQDINYIERINGTLIGLLHPRNAVATIDFKDDFHAKYHFNSSLLRNSYTTAYIVGKDEMDFMLNNKID